MPKSKVLTPTNVLIAFVVLYGGYRVIKTSRRAQPALPPQRNPLVLPARPEHVERYVVDWILAGTEENIVHAIETALAIDGHRINSSIELAYAAGARLWPGASIHPDGLEAVRAMVRKQIRWNSVDDLESDEFHEAYVRLRAKASRTLEEALEVYDGTIDQEVLQDTVATAVFPEIAWPPSEDSPPWQHRVWGYCGGIVEAALQAAARDNSLAASAQAVPLALPNSSDDITSPIEDEAG